MKRAAILQQNRERIEKQQILAFPRRALLQKCNNALLIFVHSAQKGRPVMPAIL